MIDESLLLTFVEEALEMIEEIEPTLIETQNQCTITGSINMEDINKIFRLFHSIKGSAGFFSLKNVVSVTHEAETLLDLLRTGKAKLSSCVSGLLCRALDELRRIIGLIAENSGDGGLEGEVAPLLADLRSVIEAVKDGREPVLASDSSTGRPEVTEAPNDTPVINLDDDESWGMEEQSAPVPEDVKETAPQAEPPEGEKHPKISQEVLDEAVFVISPEMKERFVVESDELLELAEHSLLQLDERPEGQAEYIGEAFRAFHSLKGNCGFMGLKDLEALSHRIEAILDGVKESGAKPDPQIISTILKMIDTMRGGVADVSSGGRGEIQGSQLLVELLEDILPKARKPRAAPANAHEEKQAAALTPQASRDKDGINGAGAVSEKTVVRRKAEDKPLAREEVKPSATGAGRDAPAASSKPSVPDASRTGDEEKTAEPGRQSTITRRDIRVDLDKLDLLINLVGELVIAESMVTRNSDLLGLELENFEHAAHHLRRIISDLQDVAMSVRMIPLSMTFRKMIRLVHDLSVKSGKKIKLELAGEETEVDKTVIEQIADPLVHIVRNSADHGIEHPEDRIKDGKPETGTILIEAKHEGGEVWIVIKDDGRGLNRSKILNKAMEKGLVRGDGAALSDEDIFRLIFEPGFSTADRVTDISGRGVGMDVVKRNIEKLKGRVDIRCTPGQGTAIILRIPLTLAIIEGMLVRVGDARYTIPMPAIRESFRPLPEQITVTMDGQEVVKVREEIIPVIRMHEIFDKDSEQSELVRGILIIVEYNNKTVCLFTDEILGQHQTVIKGVPDYLGNVRGISGCTILGDGAVSLILDVGGIIEMAERKFGV